MERGNLSRRGFMQRSLAAMAAAGLPAWYARETFGAEQREAAARARRADANSRIVLGAIGCGGQGNHIMDQARHDKNVQVVAVCDVDAKHRKTTAKKVGNGCKDFEDFRQLLDNDDINAVTVGTPDHWHTLVAIAAMKKGKDVYCEKPLTLTIAEGKALVKVAKETGRIFQVGSQQRSDRRFRLACELVRNGRLGKVKTVETWIGGNPKGGPFKVSQPPPELNWDFWQGQTPSVPYIKERCHYQFRWWYEYSGGKMTDWGAHHNDIAQWGLGMDGSGPVAVEAEGEAPSADPHSYNCHPTFKVTYTYANGTKLVCTSKENGVRFEGEGGKWIFVSRSKIEASDPKLLDEPLPPDAVRLYVSNNHMGNFLEGVRTRKPTVCPAEVGHRSVSVCHLGVIALRSGKKLKWDPAQEVFVGDDEANKWLSRPMRAPWKLEA
jgi:predicted dehydrogenase